MHRPVSSRLIPGLILEQNEFPSALAAMQGDIVALGNWSSDPP